jgi:hypothetical protein
MGRLRSGKRRYRGMLYIRQVRSFSGCPLILTVRLAVSLSSAPYSRSLSRSRRRRQSHHLLLHHILHPVLYASAYPTLSSLFQRFIPLFERVLTTLQNPPKRRIFIDYRVAGSWYGKEEYEGDENEEDYWEKWEEFMEKRELRLPEPEKWTMPEQEEDEEAFSLKGRKLQVRVLSVQQTRMQS